MELQDSMTNRVGFVITRFICEFHFDFLVIRAEKVLMCSRETGIWRIWEVGNEEENMVSTEEQRGFMWRMENGE
jgi:hypothetical protein